MATKKKAKVEVINEVNDISIIEMLRNNRVPKLTIVAPPQYEINWDQIAANVKQALEEHERHQLVEAAPYHPGYEGAVVKTKHTKAKTKKK